MLGRTLFQQLSKLGGVPGWLLSSAIAASMTAVMGYASMVWFDKGERISQKTLTDMSKKLTTVMVSKLKTALKHKPSKQKMEGTMREILSETLHEAPPTQKTE